MEDLPVDLEEEISNYTALLIESRPEDIAAFEKAIEWAVGSEGGREYK